MKLPVKLFFFLLTGAALSFAAVNLVEAGHCTVSNGLCSYSYTGGCNDSDPSDPDCSQCSGGDNYPDGSPCGAGGNFCSGNSCVNIQNRCQGGSCVPNTEGHNQSACNNGLGCSAPPPPAPPGPTPTPAPPPPGSITCYRCVNGNAYCENYNTTNSSCSSDCSACAAQNPPPPPGAPPPNTPAQPAAPPMCPLPTQVQNIKVDCPYCAHPDGCYRPTDTVQCLSQAQQQETRNLNFNAVCYTAQGNPAESILISQNRCPLY